MIKFIIAIPPSITVIMDTGEVIVGTATKEQAEYFALNKDKIEVEEVLQTILPKDKYDQISKSVGLVDKINFLLSTGDFRYDGESLYSCALVDLPISLPDTMVNRFEKLYKSDSLSAYQDIDNLHAFWMWACMNPNAQSRDSMYEYLRNYSLPIVKGGFFVAFRRMQSIGYSEKEVQAANQFYTDLRRKKKSTNVEMYKNLNGIYSLSCTEGYELVGIIKEVAQSEIKYRSISKSHYTNDYQYYNLFEEVSLPDEQVDWNPNEMCSAGLHLHMGFYEDSGYGDTLVACLVNPMDVAACPLEYDSKMRVRRLFPFKIIDSVNSFHLNENDQKVIEYYTQSYKSQLAEKSINEEEFQKQVLTSEVGINLLFRTPNFRKAIITI